MNNMAVPDKEYIERLYIGEQKPIHRIAEQLNMSVGKIYKYIKKYDIKTRPLNHKRNDNRKENLRLMTKSEHMSYHMRKRWEEKKNA